MTPTDAKKTTPATWGCVALLVVAAGLWALSEVGQRSGGEKPQAEQSMARAWVSTASGTADVTTLEQYTAQMPNGIQTAIEREGQNRRLVWTWTDGSRVVATFRPRGREGSGEGLVLYMIEVE